MTRIFVIRRKHLLFCGIALILIILLIILVIGMSKRSRTTESQETISEIYSTEDVYVPGVYTGQITVGSYNATLEVLVDGTQVKNVRMSSADEAVETMYPLVGSSVSSINDALRSGTALDELVSDNSQGYTYALIMSELNGILNSARVQP